MSQTILDEYIAAWEVSSEQPDPTKYGFDGMISMLTEAQEAMANLGESANRSRERQNTINHLMVEISIKTARIRQLEQALADVQRIAEAILKL
jgi:coenzyme F420-reducing hydrogenase delta subunit